MARASKKDFIVEIASQVFLENGFKGTSVDMVVTACGVSKPTVYNHFPDKTELMTAVMNRWLALHQPLEYGRQALSEVDSPLLLETALASHWWSAENMPIYRLVIGEGWRFAAAAERFWQEFDVAWRALALSRHQQLLALNEPDETFSAWISHQLWKQLH